MDLIFWLARNTRYPIQYPALLYLARYSSVLISRYPAEYFTGYPVSRRIFGWLSGIRPDIRFSSLPGLLFGSISGQHNIQVAGWIFYRISSIPSDICLIISQPAGYLFKYMSYSGVRCDIRLFWYPRIRMDILPDIQYPVGYLDGYLVSGRISNSVFCLVGDLASYPSGYFTGYPVSYRILRWLSGIRPDIKFSIRPPRVFGQIFVLFYILVYMNIVPDIQYPVGYLDGYLISGRISDSVFCLNGYSALYPVNIISR